MKKKSDNKTKGVCKMILASDILFDYTFALNLDCQVWSWVFGSKSEKIIIIIKNKSIIM